MRNSFNISPSLGAAMGLGAAPRQGLGPRQGAAGKSAGQGLNVNARRGKETQKVDPAAANQIAEAARRKEAVAALEAAGSEAVRARKLVLDATVAGDLGPARLAVATLKAAAARAEEFFVPAGSPGSFRIDIFRARNQTALDRFAARWPDELVAPAAPPPAAGIVEQSKLIGRATFDRRPVADARLVLVALKDGARQELIIAPDGSFDTGVVKPGAYEVHVIPDSGTIKPASAVVDLKPGEQLDLSVDLLPAAEGGGTGDGGGNYVGVGATAEDTGAGAGVGSEEGGGGASDEVFDTSEGDSSTTEPAASGTSPLVWFGLGLLALLLLGGKRAAA